MASEAVLEFTDDNFDSEVIQSDVPVLVDFWAPWCGPCRMIAPTIDELARDNQGKIRVGKLNTDEAPRSAARYNVSSIPTVMVFKKGSVVQRFVGVQPKIALQRALDDAAAS